MRRTIVLEGPDGAGKSTLSKELSLLSGRRLVTTGGPNYTRDDLLDRLASIESEDQGVIFDRVSHLSQFIYEGPPTDEREHLMPQGEMVERLRTSMNPIVIFCRLPSVDEMLASIDANRKAHKPPEFLAKVRAAYPTIVSRYDELMEYLGARGFDVLRWNWKRDDPAELLRDITLIESVR